MISTAIQQLVNYGLDTGLILPDDEIYIRNQLLMTMQLDDFTAPEGEVCYTDLESILKTLVDDAVARGVCEDNSTARDLFDTKLMGVLTPRPSIVRANFDGTESFGRTVAEQLRSGPRTHSGDCCVAEYGLLDTAQQIFGNANRIGYDVQRGEITEAFLCQRFVMRIVGQFERHRTVAARPGQVIHPQCRGCHAQ